MQAFDAVHQAIHYPPDRRFRLWINSRFILAFAVVALVPVAIAWSQYLIAGQAGYREDFQYYETGAEI